MTKLFFPFTIVLFSFFLQSVSSQTMRDENTYFPLNPNPSPVFGMDIIINDLAFQNQRNMSICSAPNGWLYAVYTFDSISNIGYYIMMSKDEGLSWERLSSRLFPGPDITAFTKMNISATGVDSINQKIFISYCCNYIDGTNKRNAMEAVSYSCFPFKLEKVLYYIDTYPNHDIALEWDNDYPAVTSNPFSLGILFSLRGVKDSLIFLSSSDGGLTLNNRVVVAVSPKHIHKVALAYGRSSSKSAGQYFAVWEEQADTMSNLGHIYSSHSSPNFNSKFTAPVMVDGLDQSLTNLCRNPVVACQANTADNDSTDLTQVIMFEKYNSTTNEYDIAGFYNKKAATGTTFNKFNLAEGSHNQQQPEITYNAYDSTFNATYYDSTDHKLILLTNNMNLTSPNTWNVISQGYNESFTLVKPNPKVKIIQGLHKPITGWVADRSNENGVALFDATYIPNVGITEKPSDLEFIGISPNPCSNFVEVSFNTKIPGTVIIELFNFSGQLFGTITEQCQPGEHNVKFDLSSIPQGIYLIALTSEIISKSKKVVIIK